MKIRKGLQIAFLIVGILAAMEFIFVRGMFTWLIAVIAVIVFGMLNIILSIKYKDWLQTCLYALLTTALCMGYFVML